jgi:hypothetical protein
MYVRYLQRRASDRALSREDYDALGGVVGALRSRADEEYDALEVADQATMQRMMLRMVGGGSGNLARRRVHDEELTFPNADENGRVERVRQRLVAARLLVEGKDAEGDPYLEPAHDALVRAWGRLVQWIQQAGSDAVPLVTRQKLALEAADWKRATDKATRDGLLWRDRVRSAMLAPVVRTKAPWLNATELEFARRSVRGRLLARAAVYGITAFVGGLAMVSFALWRDSEKNRLKAESNAEAARASALAANTARQAAEAEKRRAVRSLFSSLKIKFSEARPGSVCVHPECGAALVDSAKVWIVLARIPNDIPAFRAPNSPTVVRDFIAAREFGMGHVLVYGHEGSRRIRRSVGGKPTT